MNAGRVYDRLDQLVRACRPRAFVFEPRTVPRFEGPLDMMRWHRRMFSAGRSSGKSMLGLHVDYARLEREVAEAVEREGLIVMDSYVGSDEVRITVRNPTDYGIICALSPETLALLPPGGSRA